VPVRALLASPLGLLIGLALGALGGGGSILAVPALVYGAGQGVREATASSLLLVGLAALVGLRGHARAGRVRVATGVTFGVVGVAGSLMGSALNRRLDPDVLLLAFSGLVLVAAWRMVTACPTCTRVGEAREMRADVVATGAGGLRVRTRVDARTALLVALAGTGVGFLTGLFGVGGGFVIVPALTLVLHLAMPEAIGTSLLVIAINSAVAFAARAASTTIEWGVTIPFALAAIAGVLWGTRIADRIDATRSLRAFAVLLVVVATYSAARAILALT
jgi:uncharacterized membrane protein YfcA